jgi:CRP/FNR family cyclic AMP-dependent transcriptional regulator
MGTHACGEKGVGRPPAAPKKTVYPARHRDELSWFRSITMAKRGSSGPIAFGGRAGQRRLHEAVRSQPLVAGDVELARSIIKCGDLLQYKAGEELARQGDEENHLFLLVSGEVTIHVNRRAVAVRAAGTHVGEMALVDQLAKRSATVVANESTVALRVPEHRFSALAEKYPELWRRVAVEVARRLRERNKHLKQPHNDPVLFIGSSTEGRVLTDDIYKRFVPRPVVPRPWTEGVFQASRTSIENLVAAAQDADFAALVLTADDMTISRGKKKPSPRDNVIFELGLFMGTLGRERVFILKPKGLDVRIPSDLLGVVWLEYLKSGRRAERLRSTCRLMWEQIRNLGPR